MLHNKESVTCEKKRVTEQGVLNATKLACVQEIGEGGGGGGLVHRLQSLKQRQFSF